MVVQSFIRDVKLEYLKSSISISSVNYKFMLGSSCINYLTYAACTLEVENYMFEWSSWLVIRFLLIMYDPTIISQQQRQY
jgi:hypothetical protein